MDPLIVGFMVTAAEHFPYEQGNDLNRRCIEMLSKRDIELVFADRLVVDPDSAYAAANKFRSAGIDVLISMVSSFTWDNMPVRVAQELGDIPVLLWGVPEPPMLGGRLEANSLVGVTMNSAAFERLGIQRKFIYGFPEDAEVSAEIDRSLRVLAAIKKIRHARLGIVGGRPPGFYGSTFDELKLRKALGIEIIPIEVSEVLAGADRIPQTQLESTRARVRALGQIGSADEGDIDQVARLYESLRVIVEREKISGIAIKCWPELKDLHFNPCVVNGMFTDEQVMLGCETDVHGTITMMIENALNSGPSFFCDLVTFDEKDNTVLLWHCGAAAASMAKDPTSRRLEKPSIGTGTATLEFPLKTGRGVFARLGVMGAAYRCLVVSGEAVPTGMLLRGNNLLFRPDGIAVRKLVTSIIDKGIEHHYAFAYGEELKPDLIEFFRWLKIEVETCTD
jgi:L-fucose isomerase-like protein